MPHIRSVDRLDTDRCGLLVIDVQEKLAAAVPSAKNVTRQIERLCQTADVLAVPRAATVQYPRGLGPLVPPLAAYFESPEEKLDFSAAVCRDALDNWASLGRDQIVVTGMESHVCILQTVLDLIAEGQRPFVVVEAVASRHGDDHEIALQRMRDAGATLVTTETVMFEWLSTADRPEFKTISKMVK